MVLWSDVLLERLDENQVKIRLWARKRDSNYFTCILCNSDFKYSWQGFKAFQKNYTKAKTFIIIGLALWKYGNMGNITINIYLFSSSKKVL